MPVRVVNPPEAIVTPADIAGSHTAGDAAVAALIASVTEDIDGPGVDGDGGWLGRCLGPQILEFVGWLGCERYRLPFGPIIKIESVTSEDADGNSEAVDPSTWRLDSKEIVISAGAAWVTRPRHIIRYKAGYNGWTGAGIGEVQTGPVPERARQAIILSVQDLIRQSASGPMLRSEATEDVRSVSYVDPDKISATVERTCERLLQTLRVYNP